MKLTIERAALLKALGHVQSVVERRTTIPILSNVLLRAEGGDPVLLLDDVFAELDTARREALAAAAASAEQVLVTAAVLDDIPRDWDAKRVTIALHDGEFGAAVTESRRTRTDHGDDRQPHRGAGFPQSAQ